MTSFLMHEQLQHLSNNTSLSPNKRPYENTTLNQQSTQYHRTNRVFGGRGFGNGRDNGYYQPPSQPSYEDQCWENWHKEKNPEWEGNMICRNIIWHGTCNDKSNGRCNQPLHQFPQQTPHATRQAIIKHTRKMPSRSNPCDENPLNQ